MTMIGITKHLSIRMPMRWIVLVPAVCLIVYSHLADSDNVSFMRSSLFTAVTDTTGRFVCISDQPDQMRTVRSRAECVLACQDVYECLSVNWKAGSNLCEIHLGHPTNVSRKDDCWAYQYREFLIASSSSCCSL